MAPQSETTKPLKPQASRRCSLRSILLVHAGNSSMEVEAQVIEVVALHAGNKRHAHLAGEEWVFAVGFLAASPARIAEDVDVGRPEGQPIKDSVVALSLCLVILRAGFAGDGLSHIVDNAGVPGGGHADGLGKHSR